MTHTSTEQPEALPTPEAVMEQAQVFASAWALYGSGSILEPANSQEVAAEAEEELAQMVRRQHARILELEAELENSKASSHQYFLERNNARDTVKQYQLELEAAQAGRVALSDADIELAMAWCDVCEGDHVLGAFTAGVRHVEKLYGITQEKQG